jgi:hypothetical protein
VRKVRIAIVAVKAWHSEAMRPALWRFCCALTLCLSIDACVIGLAKLRSKCYFQITVIYTHVTLV